MLMYRSAVDLGLKGAAIVTGQPRDRPGHRPGLVAERAHASSCAPATPDRLRRRHRRDQAGGAVNRRVIPARAAAPGIVDTCLAAFRAAQRARQQRPHSSPKPLAASSPRRLGQDGLELNFLFAARLARGRRARDRGRRMGPHGPRRLDQRPEPDPLLRAVLGGEGGADQPSTSLAQTFGRDGVHSELVVPGITLTELVDANAAQAAEQAGSTPDDVISRDAPAPSGARRPLRHPRGGGRRGAVPVQQRASWVSGATLEVDGGTLRST